MKCRGNSQRIAYRYLYGFRRTIPPLAAALSLVAWLSGWQALAAGLFCIAVGELLETSYYLSVLRWAERSSIHRTPRLNTCTSSWKRTA